MTDRPSCSSSEANEWRRSYGRACATPAALNAAANVRCRHGPQLNNALLLTALSTSRRDWWQGEEVADLEHPTPRILGGVPNLAWLNVPGSYGGEDGGHLDLAPVTPLTVRDSLRVRDLLKKPAHRGTRPRRAVVCRPAMGCRPSTRDGESRIAGHAYLPAPAVLRSRRRAPLARRETRLIESKPEGDDASTHRRRGHGRTHDRPGPAGIGRLHHDRRVRADADAEHRGSGAEHPAERRAAGPVAGRRPRRRRPQGARRGGRRRQGGDPPVDADDLGGQLRVGEAARPQHGGRRQRRLPPHAPPRP